MTGEDKMPVTEQTHLDELPVDSPRGMVDTTHVPRAPSLLFLLLHPATSSSFSFEFLWNLPLRLHPSPSIVSYLGFWGGFTPVRMVPWFRPASAHTTLLPERALEPTAFHVPPWPDPLASSADVALFLLTGLFWPQSTPSCSSLFPCVGAVYFSFSTSCPLPQDLSERSYPSALASPQQSCSLATSGPWVYAVVTLSCSALLLPQVLASAPVKLSRCWRNEWMREREREGIYTDLAAWACFWDTYLYEKC